MSLLVEPKRVSFKNIDAQSCERGRAEIYSMYKKDPDTLKARIETCYSRIASYIPILKQKLLDIKIGNVDQLYNFEDLRFQNSKYNPGTIWNKDDFRDITTHEIYRLIRDTVFDHVDSAHQKDVLEFIRYKLGSEGNLNRVNKFFDKIIANKLLNKEEKVSKRNPKPAVPAPVAQPVAAVPATPVVPLPIAQPVPSNPVQQSTLTGRVTCCSKFKTWLCSALKTLRTAFAKLFSCCKG